MDSFMDLDTIIERKNTDCLKFDAATRRGYPEDILPLWVADMDFPAAPPILEALKKRITHGVFGYSEPDSDRFFPVLERWFRERHNWQIQKDWLLQTPGVVFALAMAVKAFTEPGDAVLIQQPVYYPFSEVILDNGRHRVSSDLLLKGGRYEIDFADFERKIVENKVKLFLLCSPHNPVGRVWTRDELEMVAAICRKHNVIVIADEIHEDFVWTERPHIPYASLGGAIAEKAVICTAPSKTFNLAGLQVSNIFIPDYGLRRRFKHEINAAGYSQLNTLGLIACEAAYGEGFSWLQEVKQYLRENIDLTRAFLQQHIPWIRLVEPEGTYLLWLDCRGLGLSSFELDEFIIKKAGLWLDSGAIFGAAGKGFQRINVACPRSVLQEALERIQRAISCCLK
ncbi:MAG: pyridoxal phosphate-dependent aminotransferase [Acidaminococcaceae bacterium]|nr:pyridoxal phosphate-dependent aminotransferase [Acidaminococcaceae bacterium]MBP3263888.1 pyridoxal phosphate-dependent aminotransferase [Acidaminococcaceae bacterium]